MTKAEVTRSTTRSRARVDGPGQRAGRGPEAQEQRRWDEEHTPPPAPPAPREAQQRPVMRGDHPVRVPVGARTLDVDDGPTRFVADSPSGLAEAPAQIDVLDVHEVPLGPAVDRVEGGAPE